MNQPDATLRIRAATPDDAEVIYRFIVELADYERLSHEVSGSVESLRRDLGGAHPACSALLAEQAGEPVGFALVFETYSTFHTSPCLHLEDLFVVPAARGSGVGAELLRECARWAVARGCPRLQWNVLDWNESAIGFYEQLGARVLQDWRTCRVDGVALTTLANRESGR